VSCECPEETRRSKEAWEASGNDGAGAHKVLIR